MNDLEAGISFSPCLSINTISLFFIQTLIVKSYMYLNTRLLKPLSNILSWYHPLLVSRQIIPSPWQILIHPLFPSCHFLPLKLDRHNYSLWRAQFIPLPRSHSLLPFVDGTSHCPPTFLLDAEGQLTDDRTLNPTGSDVLLKHEGFSRPIRSFLTQPCYSTELLNLPRGDLCIADFFDRINTLTDQLALSGSPMKTQGLPFKPARLLKISNIEITLTEIEKLTLLNDTVVRGRLFKASAALMHLTITFITSGGSEFISH
ncbi:unnamed protein product [Malus baccata var. baccata]